MYRIIVKVYSQNMIDIVSHHQMLINEVAYQKVCDKCIAAWCWSGGRAQRGVVVYQKVCDKCISAWSRIGGRESTLYGGVTESM